MATNFPIRFVSFNMHGYNQSKDYLSSLCSNYDIVFVQEHLLLPSELNLLTACAPKFVLFGSSALSSCISRGLMRGRPYGGVAILVRSEMALKCQLVCCSDRYVIVKWRDALLVCVYMPCKGTTNYEDSYRDTIADITAVIHDNVHRWLICGGDLNLDFAFSGPMHDVYLNLLAALSYS